MRAIAILMLLASCRSPAGGCEVLTVLAAASLEPALGEQLRALPGVRVSYGGSGALLRQIEAGAPAGLFLSAGVREAEALVRQGRAAGAPVEFASNALVVVVPRGAPRPASLGDLTGLSRLALGDPASVPAGRYARQALERAGLLQAVGPALVLAQDVTQALAWVRTGEADAGFVYRTDARSTPQVDEAFEVPSTLHDPVRYVAVPIAGACAVRGRELAAQLRSGPLVRALLEAGFTAAAP